MPDHSHIFSLSPWGQYDNAILPQVLLLLLNARISSARPSDGAAASTSADIIDTSLFKTACDLLFRGSICSRFDCSKTLGFSGMVAVTILCGLGLFHHWKKHRMNKDGGRRDGQENSNDPSTTDPGFLKKYSSFNSYTTPNGFTYPRLRTVYRAHSQQDKLPKKPCAIPLIVLIHGLGGSAAQFNAILTSLVNLAPCLAIDLPGCGLSSFEPKNWEAYTTDALVHLIAAVIESYREKSSGQGIVLIGHSMGCSLAALLSSSTSPFASLISEHVLGFVAICPQAEPLDGNHRKGIRTATSIPAFLFDVMRKWDRRGGTNSKSVVRMVGPAADKETRRLQLRYNKQSRTNVWRRMAYGVLLDLPGKDVWAGLQIPVYLFGGEDDRVTPKENIQVIAGFLGKDVAAMEPLTEKGNSVLVERKKQDSGIDASDLPRWNFEALSTETEPASTIPTPSTPPPHPRRLLVKYTVFPSPASHSVLFAPSTSRTLSGLIGTFFANHVDPRLSAGWQLQYLTTEGKWEVKNLQKWLAIRPVSAPIGHTFRAMKTLREVDEQHSPKVFVHEWATRIRAVIDISHDNPVYDPEGLQAGGIRYYKFPTVSKLPPTIDEVKDFITLIDRLRRDQGAEQGLIGVHCHYGFNRTGFFLVSYLVERLQYRLQDAIDEFAAARTPGIKHDHFINELHVRYAVGLKRAPTL